jgi:hypothetical protein
VSELREESDQIQKLRQEKDSEMQAMKLKYEEMESTLQNILTVISNLEQSVDKKKIAQVSR